MSDEQDARHTCMWYWQYGFSLLFKRWWLWKQQDKLGWQPRSTSCSILGKGIIFSKLTLSDSSQTGETFGSLSQFLNQRFWGGCEILNALPPSPPPVSPLLSSVPFTPSSLLWNVKQISPIPVTGCAMWRAPNCAQNVNAYLPHQLEHCAVCCSLRRVLGQK